MSKLSDKIRKLQDILKLHTDWLVYTALGPEALSAESYKTLQKRSPLPLTSVGLVEAAFNLGKVRASSKRSEYANVSSVPVNKLSEVDELAVTEARLKAARNFKKLVAEVEAAVNDGLSAIAADALRQHVLHDEVANTIEQLRSAKELANRLESRLGKLFKANWLRLAKTELHRAKVAAHAQAIANREGLYAKSNGPQSFVSVIPGPNCCLDCKRLYLDGSGNPKIFVLQDLLVAGNNLTSGVSHTKTAGVHTGWKPTLPPLHPNCGCTLQFIPPGHSWISGNLALVNKSLFFETLKKATDGVSGGISSSVTPAGPPKKHDPASPTPENNVPSVPGVAAPGNLPGPGRPKGSVNGPGNPGDPSGGEKYVPCPFGGEAECREHGGNGAKMHLRDGTVMKRHQEAMARGANASVTPEGEKKLGEMKEAQAKQFGLQPTPRDELLTHLSEGTIAHAKTLSEGITEGSYVISIDGNGRACLKSAPDYPDHLYHPETAMGIGDGASTTPRGAGHKSEAAAFLIANSLGLSFVPETVVRENDGDKGTPKGPVSVQSWQEGHLTVSDLQDQTGIRSVYRCIMTSVPEHKKDEVEETLQSMAVLDIIINNNDRHSGNLIVSTETGSVKAIDHGFSFGSGMQGHKNSVAFSLKNSGKQLKIPEALYARLKAHSLSDTERALEGTGLKSWQIMQTHLRKKYVVHLQERHGYIPTEALADVLYGCNSDTGVKADFKMGGPFGWEGDSPIQRLFAVKDAESKGLLPDQLFSSWAKEYILQHANDPTSPHYEECKKMETERPLIPPGDGWFHDGPGPEDYWNSIPAYKGLPVTNTTLEDSSVSVREPPKIPSSDTNLEQQNQSQESKDKEEPKAKTKLEKKKPSQESKDKEEPKAKTKPGKKKPLIQEPIDPALDKTYAPPDFEEKYLLPYAKTQKLSIEDNDKTKKSLKLVLNLESVFPRHLTDLE